MSIETPRSAMVLAAGFGTRMRPLTDTCPKPLLTVGGRSLLDRVLDALVAAGIERIGVNGHYLSDQIGACVSARADDRIRYAHEAEILDSGGGVVNMLDWLGRDGPLLVLNADQLWRDGSAPRIERLIAHYNPARMDVLQSMHRLSPAEKTQYAGDYHLLPDGRLQRRKPDERADFMYSGLFVIDPALFANAPQAPFSLNLLWDRAQAKGRLHGLEHDGDWFHLSTPQDLIATEAAWAAS